MQEYSSSEHNTFHAYAAAEWSKLEDKTEWEELANADKEIYAYKKSKLQKVGADIAELCDNGLLSKLFQVSTLPRHPRSAYIHWISEHKERLKRESREAGMNYNAHAASEWAKLEDKTPWESLAAADKEAYAEEKLEVQVVGLAWMTLHNER